jgi:hypothetical protein
LRRRLPPRVATRQLIQKDFTGHASSYHSRNGPNPVAQSSVGATRSPRSARPSAASKRSERKIAQGITYFVCLFADGGQPDSVRLFGERVLLAFR